MSLSLWEDVRYAIHFDFFWCRSAWITMLIRYFERNCFTIAVPGECWGRVMRPRHRFPVSECFFLFEYFNDALFSQLLTTSRTHTWAIFYSFLVVMRDHLLQFSARLSGIMYSNIVTNVVIAYTAIVCLVLLIVRFCSSTGFLFYIFLYVRVG